MRARLSKQHQSYQNINRLGNKAQSKIKNKKTEDQRPKSEVRNNTTE